jgi:hypothetical protein
MAKVYNEKDGELEFGFIVNITALVCTPFVMLFNLIRGLK